MQDPDSTFRKHLKRLNQLINDGGSLSGNERNCAFLNVRGGRFATVSSVSGLDLIDDARTPVRVDWDHDGDLDLWVGNRTAPQLRFLRNETPHANHFVALQLRGTKTNRDGIGARVEIWQNKPAGDSGEPVPLIKTLQAGEGFLGQSSKWLHFGLGASPEIDHVVVRWPGGAAESFSSVQGDGWYRLEEGQGRANPVVVNPIQLPEKPRPAPVSPNPAAKRLVTSTRTGLPPLRYADFDGTIQSIPLGASGRSAQPVLINLWASWCRPCMQELKAWKENADRLEQAGIRVFALSVDAIDGNTDSSLSTAQQASDGLALPFVTGMVTNDLFSRLEQSHNWPFRRRLPLPVPTSFLVDENGRLTVIYHGTVAVQKVIDDTKLFAMSQPELRDAALPFPGKWFFPPNPPRPMPRGIELMGEGDVTDAAEFVDRNLELLRPHKEFPLLAIWIGDELMKVGEVSSGLRYLELAAKSGSSDIAVLNNLAWQYAANPDPRVRNPQKALQWAKRANEATKRSNPTVIDTVAVAYAATGDFTRAVDYLEQAKRIATASGDEALVRLLSEHLRLFQAKKPYLDPPPQQP